MAAWHLHAHIHPGLLLLDASVSAAPDIALYSVSDSVCVALQGALQHIDEPEAQHWMRMACCRSLATCADSVQGLLQNHGQKATGQTVAFQVKTLLQRLQHPGSYLKVFAYMHRVDPR